MTEELNERKKASAEEQIKGKATEREKESLEKQVENYSKISRTKKESSRD